MPDQSSNGHNKVFILTGDPGSGKSSFLVCLVEILRNHGLLLAGFTAPSLQGSLPQRSYEFIVIGSGESIPLASESPTSGWQQVGKFWFNPEAISRGNNILSDPAICRSDLIVIDEIGHFELQGRVWAEAITGLCQKKCNIMLWTVRESLLERVIRHWKLEEPTIIKIEDHSPDKAAKILLLYSQA